MYKALRKLPNFRTIERKRMVPMLLKPRPIPQELLLLRTLSPRMLLPEELMDHLIILEKGYEGELKFDAIVDNHKNNYVIIRDLLLEYSQSEFQLDNLLLTPKGIYQLEVKNFEGEHSIENDTWYASSGTKIKNPLLQLKRSENLLSQLLYKMKANMKVHSLLVFVNTEFTLYGSSQNMPIILPSQINKLFTNLNRDYEGDNFITPRLKAISNQLVKLHKNESSYNRIPEYNYHLLKKGLVCSHCYSWMIKSMQGRLECPSCNKEENYSSAIQRSINELTLLFPNIILTAGTLFEWCGDIISRKTIQRFLSEKYKMNGRGKSAFYERV
ncbi:NERD domain-containing protein [Evansella sp. LMS18]|uniref:nuclease-related domain-containing protein n=1 Tax=Evansella sp. LMS18 TaxID=2924033 RepID=UPI0020D02C1F|nr:nuclease-related domain-containing protein [Evansella sp. LMS18]UTR09886.1 NERD domain-containing protein [Evansella sp. LMS18]